MSGYVALVNLDGSPIDARLLRRMTAFLAFRGPDGQNSQILGEAGLGYALLRVGDESIHGRQPFTIDERYWVVGDVRVDARAQLAAALAGAGQQPASSASDVELIVRAYAAWGDRCPERLLGDFSFAIWDARERVLFCARDHFGVRPLFHTRAASTIVVSNTLDCLRLHPHVSDGLDERAVADFLLFGENRTAESTVFEDIRRLPAAHWGSWSMDAVRLKRFWSMPIDDPVHFRREHEYVDRFNELLHEAVTDRLRTSHATILMSGGLDSPTLAATAVRAGRRHTGFVVDAITSVYDHLIPDLERNHAAAVARHLDIPIRYDARDHETSITDWDRLSVRTPEPVANPAAFAAGVQFLVSSAQGGRVFFYGEGPDTALQYEWRRYLSHLHRTRQFSRLASALALELVRHPRVPLWSSVRQLATKRSRTAWEEQFPNWLEQSFSTRCGCRDRWASQQAGDDSLHPVRPRAYAALGHIRWQSLFEDCDVSGSHGHAEFRYPFLDIRLLRYLLAVPAMPWCRNKLIIRRSMASALPSVVIRRNKRVMEMSADFVRAGATGLPHPTSSPQLRRYVDTARIPKRVSTEVELRAALRALGLGYWLTHYATVESKEPQYGIETAIPV